MVGKCLAEDKAFVIVLFGSQSIRSTGCTTRVTEVIED
jgi:hypothetical protein